MPLASHLCVGIGTDLGEVVGQDEILKGVGLTQVGARKVKPKGERWWGRTAIVLFIRAKGCPLRPRVISLCSSGELDRF